MIEGHNLAGLAQHHGIALGTGTLEAKDRVDGVVARWDHGPRLIPPLEFDSALTAETRCSSAKTLGTVCR